MMPTDASQSLQSTPLRRVLGNRKREDHFHDDDFPLWGDLCVATCCVGNEIPCDELNAAMGNSAASLVAAIFAQARIDILLHASSQREFAKAVADEHKLALAENAQGAIEFLESRRRFAFYARYLLGTDDRAAIEEYREKMLVNIRCEIDGGRSSSARVNIRGSLDCLHD